MPSYEMRNKVIEEIGHVPDENLETVYELIRNYRMGLEETIRPENPHEIPFGRCWKEVPAHAFDSIVEQIARRRQKGL